MGELICWLIGHTRKLERRWCPYSTMRFTDRGDAQTLPAGGKYHLYCQRCGRGVAVDQ